MGWIVAFFARIYALIPRLFSAFKLFAKANFGGFAIQILAALGLNFLIVAPATEGLTDLISQKITGLPLVLLDWVGFFGVDQYFSILLSAYGIAITKNFVMNMKRPTP